MSHQHGPTQLVQRGWRACGGSRTRRSARTAGGEQDTVAMRMPHVSSASAVMATIIAIELEVEERGTIVLLKEK
jgi:hypothetical protein